MAKGLGRVPHEDPRNFLLTRVLDDIPKRLSVADRVARALGIRRARKWRQWAYYFQGESPACTGYGSANKVAAAPVRPTMALLRALDPMAWYAANVAEDRRKGRFFSEGATTLAAMQVGKRLGHWSEYRFSYNVDEWTPVLHDSDAVVIGSNWYDSMWDRDKEGIARITAGSANAGGHLYCLNGYDPRRDLYRSPSSWNDGDYLLPGDTIRRLFREDAECVVTFE